MIRVRKHTRQLASGKTAKVRQHERSGNAAVSAGITQPADREDGWWDNQGATDVSSSEDPPGTWYFSEDGVIHAVYPDGTVHPVTSEDDDEPEPVPVSEHPAGTWYFSDQGKTYAVYPDSSTHPVADEPAVGGDAEMSDAFRAMVAQNPGLAGGYSKLSALRNAGYEGPIDQDGNPTSTKDLFRARSNALKERDAALERAKQATTRDDYDAASRNYKAADDKFKALPDPAEPEIRAVKRFFGRAAQ